MTGAGAEPCSWCDKARKDAEAQGGEVRQELEEYRQLTGHYPGCPQGRRQLGERRRPRGRRRADPRHGFAAHCALLAELWLFADPAAQLELHYPDGRTAHALGLEARLRPLARA